MKRLIIVGVLLGICIAASVYTHACVQAATEYIDDSVDGALQAIVDDDKEALMEKVGALRAFWDEEEDRLIHMVRHTQIDEISRNIARLRGLAAGESYPELVAELDSIRWQMNHIDRSETLTLYNVL